MKSQQTKMPMSSFWMVEGTQVISPAGLNSRDQMYWTRKTSISQGPLLWMNFDLASRWWKTTKQLDDILCEQKKHQGPGALQWLLHMFLTSSKFLKLWRQAKIVTILKSRKDPFIPKSFRPISLLCHTYKLFERLLLNMSMFLNMRVFELVFEQDSFWTRSLCRWTSYSRASRFLTWKILNRSAPESAPIHWRRLWGSADNWRCFCQSINSVWHCQSQDTRAEAFSAKKRCQTDKSHPKHAGNQTFLCRPKGQT